VISDNALKQLVTKAVDGSKAAVEEIVLQIQRPVYSLSLRMLMNPEDARDVTQEILITVITNLIGYRFEGSFRAWVLRIATNKLKAVRKTRAEKKMASIEDLDGILDRYEARGWLSKPLAAPAPYLEAETRSICVHALLLTLDRDHRMAFILGVVLDVSSREGAEILGIEPAAYRKRLSRARTKVKDFLVHNCGVFDRANRCRCAGILPVYLKRGWIDPDRPLFASKTAAGQTSATLGRYLEEIDELKKLSWIYNALPPSAVDFVGAVREIFENKPYRIISDPKFG
jgi:RNA polymerase sigma factor (sigma-70 family)